MATMALLLYIFFILLLLDRYNMKQKTFSFNLFFVSILICDGTRDKLLHRFSFNLIFIKFYIETLLFSNKLDKHV